MQLQPFRLLAASIVSLAFSAVQAQINLTSNLNLNRNFNLLTNGSFEGHPTSGTSLRYWATGTTLGSFPFQTPNGWVGAGGPMNYADWGDSGFFHSSAPVPHGNSSMYFGNQFVASISETPSFMSSGQVIFQNAPVIVPGAGQAPPVTLSQTIAVSQGQTYGISFWASGETAARFPNTPLLHDGIFGLSITGQGSIYLAAPCGGSNLGAAYVYECTFVPITNSVTITFTNWGHFGNTISPTQGWNLPNSTELVLDDVIINLVPEPGALFVLGVGAFWIRIVRRRTK